MGGCDSHGLQRGRRCATTLKQNLALSSLAGMVYADATIDIGQLNSLIAVNSRGLMTKLAQRHGRPGGADQTGSGGGWAAGVYHLLVRRNIGQ